MAEEREQLTLRLTRAKEHKRKRNVRKKLGVLSVEDKMFILQDTNIMKQLGVIHYSNLTEDESSNRKYMDPPSAHFVEVF